jgi:hypothetical protein
MNGGVTEGCIPGMTKKKFWSRVSQLSKQKKREKDAIEKERRAAKNRMTSTGKLKYLGR